MASHAGAVTKNCMIMTFPHEASRSPKDGELLALTPDRGSEPSLLRFWLAHLVEGHRRSCRPPAEPVDNVEHPDFATVCV